MSFKPLHALFALTAGCLLMSCHSKVDFDNLDTSSEIEMGMALPVGSMHATLGDFLGNGQVPQIYVGEDGIFHFIDSVDIPQKSYHKIDVASYIIKEKATLSFPINEQISKSVINGDGKTTTELVFDVVLGISGINENPYQERLDSIWVSEAKFISIINVEDFGLNWSEIKRVRLELSDQFRRSKGMMVDIPISGKGYQQEIPINVDDFTLSLLKNKDLSQGHLNSISCKIHFDVCPANGHNIAVTDKSKFLYNLQVKVIDYEAIWGWFQAGNEMKDAQKLNMDSLWEGWKDFKKLKVRFMEPKIDVQLWHKIAAPLRMYIDYITAIDSAGNPTHATWSGLERTDFPLPNVLSPYSVNLSDSVINSKVFSQEPAEGHIDRLFDVRPDYFEYNFYLIIDQNPRTDFPWKQHRITKEAKVHGFAVIDVPFKLNEGSELEYTSTIDSVNISRISLDSLLASAAVLDTVKASDLKLILEVENSIPFDLEGWFTFLDKDSVDMKMQLLEGNQENHLRFPAPKMERPSGQTYGFVKEPSVTRCIINVDKNDFDRFAEVKKIRFDAAITGNPQPCVLDTATDLRVKIGLSAHIDAVLNFDSIANNNNTKK